MAGIYLLECSTAEQLATLDRAELTLRDAFRALIGRFPDDREAVILERMFDEQYQTFARNPADALKYVRVGDSAPDPSLAAADPAALAATTAVVNALMNLDEFVVLR